MGYLGKIFDDYYYSTNHSDKKRIKESFKNIIWDSLPYIKLNKFFKYKISYENIQDGDVVSIFEKYRFIEYKVLKSRYNINNLNKEDLIKARINSNYGKYFDNEIYLKKEYYRALAQYKNIYFNYLKGDVGDLYKEIEDNNVLVKNLKEKSMDNKFKMDWDYYKSFVNMCFDKIFDNYTPIDKKIENGDFYSNHIIDWDNDNYILGYVNKSLNGYLKNYIKELKQERKAKKYIQCTNCGKMVEKKTANSNTKYCDECAREIHKEIKRNTWHKNKNKYKH